jgi:nucleoid-associated protein YgaU
MKLRDILMAGAAVIGLYITGEFAMPSSEIKTQKPKATATATAESKQKQKQTVQPDNASEIKPLEKIVAEEKLPVFEGYENPELQKYDSMIIQYCNYWNKQFENEANYVKIDPVIVKKIIMVETAWRGTINKALRKDPMQIGDPIDFGFRLAKNGGETFYPEGGYDDAKNVDYKDITPELSIKYGIRYLIQRAIKDKKFVSEEASDRLEEYLIKKGDNPSTIAEQFGTTSDAIVNFNKIDPKKLRIGQKLMIPHEQLVPHITEMNYDDIAPIYNGGGDENYKTKFESIKPLKKP